MIPFRPEVASWFERRFGQPTPPQAQGWPAIAAGRDTLIAAPTGSGKTLAAFLWAVDRLVGAAAEGRLDDRTRVVYVSPLKALGNDIHKNLQEPLAEIAGQGHGIRVAVRTGDTPPHERRRMAAKPPHILITTPESLYILLTAPGSRAWLSGVDTCIVDEIHAVAGDKRGAHLALSLERLDHLRGARVQRIGLSATQRPIEEVGRLLTGGHPCDIVDTGHRRAMDLSVEVADQELGPIASHELWDEVYERIRGHVNAHRATLVFVQTRRLVERVSHQLAERLGEDRVAAHHGSMSRRHRLEAEQKLKSGEIAVVVATASLELGIDIGHVDLVCQIGAPRSIATLLQRVGRSGHWLGAVPKGILFPLTRDDLVGCAALVRAVRLGDLDVLASPRAPLDVLAQQMVATVASDDQGIDEDDLFAVMRRAWPYRDLGRDTFDRLLDMLGEGVAASRGRRGALLHRDATTRRARPRRGARLVAVTSGGAIPDTADYDVVEAADGTFVGRVNEDFAIESMAGDVFLLGNRSWRIQRVGSGKVYVHDAHGAHPSVPFWLGESPGRTERLSFAVSELRREVADRLDTGDAGDWLRAQAGLCADAAEQIVAYVRETVAALGCVPTMDCVVAERFFDEAGGMQLVLHAPFGARLNRAWGLALRKRFCVSFDFELQAAATDDGIVVSLGERHSFPLASVFGYVSPHSLEQDLTQAALQSPMFTTRWRWTASRALAVPRFRGGRKVPMALQRMQAEDLLAAVFPESTMCQDNRTGPIEPVDHPLVNETLEDCLREAMDLEGMRDLAVRLAEGRLRTVAVESAAPSPMSHEILNANPYAFLDDAPLEERRARAVSLRRIDPGLASGMGALDASAVAEVRAQAWPEVRGADELHDLLLSLGWLPVAQGAAWSEHAETLVRSGRALRVTLPVGVEAWVAAERASWVGGEEQARVARGWMDVLGPVTAEGLALRCGLTHYEADCALAALEAAGAVLRGSFTGAAGVEWCERGLLARIHRMTLGRLRAEIEPATPAELMRFLLAWQHVAPGTRLHGREGLLEVIGQLQGLELPAPAWEEHVFPARVHGYDPQDLEYLCLSGAVAWGRLRTRLEEAVRPGPTRSTAIAFLLRADLPRLVAAIDPAPQPASDRPTAADIGSQDAIAMSDGARAVLAFLERAGASFLMDIAHGIQVAGPVAEEALWELVSRGLVTGDGVAGLRGLLQRGRRPPVSGRLRAMRRRLVPVGRWSLWRPPASTDSEDARVEAFSRQLLRRWGVVVRELMARETAAPPWRSLLRAFRRLEARGEIRGGHFVRGLVGEQFALPEAVDAMRAMRRSHSAQEPAQVPASDPLNLVGILLPGQRISPYAGAAVTLG